MGGQVLGNTETARELNFEEYGKLKFTNNFMFCKIMENNLDLCKQMLEIILGIKIKKVVLADREKTIDITPDGKSVRLDVYVEDGEGGVYDLEMQVAPNKNLPKRTRYYQGIIDLNLIGKGINYRELKKSFVIFICLFDPFEANLPIYTFTNRCKEKLELELCDETAKVFINPDGEKEELTEDMKAFLEYLKDGTASGNEFTEKLEKEVQKARESEEWKVEYMTLAAALDDAKYEGRTEGRTEGRIEGVRILVKQLYKCGKSYEFVRDAIMEEYADIDGVLIDRIMGEVYQIGEA